MHDFEQQSQTQDIIVKNESYLIRYPSPFPLISFWLSYGQDKAIIETRKGQFINAAEGRFVDDLIIYLY
jgi:hypothetical protein